MNGSKNRDTVEVPAGRRGLYRILSAVVLLSVFAFIAACSKFETDEGVYGESSGKDALVRLTVNLPRSVSDTNGAKTISDMENHISKVKVLVFERENDNYIYRYMVEGEQIRFSGTTTQFEAKLTTTPNPIKLMLVGNYGDAFTNYTPSAGSRDITVRASIGHSFTGGMTNDLPMYGEIDILSGLQAGTENNFSIKMLRAVARVDVIKELTADSRTFRIESVYLYRPNNKIQIAPDESVSGDSPRVTVPSVFAGAQKLSVPVVVKAGESDPVSVTGIYVPEADGETDSSVQLTGVTCIVVGGYYNGQTQLSYYRIDFNSEIAGHPFGQILRNYKYIFRIKKVTGQGWSTPDVAAVNKATSIEVRVEPWEDFTTEMYFEGDNYFGLSSRSVKVGYLAGKTKQLDVQATLPYAIQWLDASGIPVGTAVSGVGAVLSGNSSFTVSITQNTGDEQSVTHLVFTAVKDNRTSSDVTARLRVTAGRWTVDVTVIQESPEKYRKRIVRVLSVSEVGDLGANTPTTADGLALRRILNNKNNFAPSGTVIIGGFSFSEVSNTEIQATGTGNAVDKEIFRSVQAVINAQDVIYLTYNSRISNELAQVVLTWLKESINRVLIVGTDTNTTNEKLRQYLAADGTWKYYVSNNIGGDFKRAAQTDNNKRFFTAPFGAVAVNAPINRADNYAGYCSDYPSNVIPLVVSSAAGQEKTLIVGVNRQNRIVYHGDANLNQSGRLSSQANTDGTITTDFDRLTANLWAWIVEQVCTE